MRGPVALDRLQDIFGLGHCGRCRHRPYLVRLQGLPMAASRAPTRTSVEVNEGGRVSLLGLLSMQFANIRRNYLDNQSKKTKKIKEDAK